MRLHICRVSNARRLMLLSISVFCAFIFMNSLLQSSTKQISYEIGNRVERENHKENNFKGIWSPHQSMQNLTEVNVIIRPVGNREDEPKEKGRNEENKTTNISMRTEIIPIKRGNVIYGDSLHLCGLQEKCKNNQIPMYFYSGKNKDDEPKICVDGRFVMSKNLNGAGRGLNVVVIYPPTKQVVRVGHFDTYAQDSSTLEIFLEQLQPTEIIALVSFDEAATKLSSLAKQLFYDLGSGLAQNMKFRSSWFFIGQKGISGFTPFEQLNYANNNEWAKPIDYRNCVPTTLDGLKTHADPLPALSNVAKRAFCKKYDGYEDFCDDSHIDDQLTPAPPLVKEQIWEITKVPMLIIAGLSHNSMRLCLETVLRQPGINQNTVLITYDENYKEVEELATLFGFKSKSVNASSSYMDQYEKALHEAWSYFADANELIVIEEELYLTIDFFHFLDQMLPILRKPDAKVFMISSWNDNGFNGSASNVEQVYRINDGSIPAMGYMITKNVYNNRMANQFKDCCHTRVWENQWKNLLKQSESIIVPEVPRVVRRRFDGLGSNPMYIKDMFSRSRTFTRSINQDITNAMEFYATDDLYRKYLRTLVATAKSLDRRTLASCFNNGKPPLLPNEILTSQAIVIYIKEAAWPIMQKCFGAYYSEGEKRPRGLFDDVLRLSYENHSLLIISELASLFSLKPSNYETISL